MSSGAEARFFAKLAEAPIETAPFPHFYLENIFTDDLYSQMLGNLPADGDLIPLGDTGLVTSGAYPERAILRLNDADTARLDEIQQIFWQDVATRFLGGRLTEMLSGRFWPHILDRFGGNLLRMRLAEEAMLVRDRTRYALGPHTDAAAPSVDFAVLPAGGQRHGASGHHTLCADRCDVSLQGRAAPSARSVQPGTHHALPAEQRICLHAHGSELPRGGVDRRRGGAARYPGLRYPHQRPHLRAAASWRNCAGRRHCTACALIAISRRSGAPAIRARQVR